MGGVTNNPVETLQMINYIRAKPNTKSAKSLDSGLNASSQKDIDAVEEEFPESESKSVPAFIYESKRKDFASYITKGEVVTVSARRTPEETSSEEESTSQGVKSSKELMSYYDSLKAIIVLHKNPVFFIICVATAVWQMVFIVVLSVLVDYANDKGMDEKYGKYMIAILAVGDLIGRVGFGWVTDNGFLTSTNFITLLYIFQGIILCLFPVVNMLLGYLIIMFPFGLSIGSIFVLFPVLLYEYVRHDLQILAVGGSGFLAGLLLLCVPPMTGYYRDINGSYDEMFFIIGGLSFITAAFFLVVPKATKLCYTDDQLKNLYGSKSRTRGK